MAYVSPLQPAQINKLLGVTITYIDPFGQREKILVFGCDISVPANWNASMTAFFEVALHTSSGDVAYQMSQPYGGSNLP